MTHGRTKKGTVRSDISLFLVLTRCAIFLMVGAKHPLQTFLPHSFESRIAFHEVHSFLGCLRFSAPSQARSQHTHTHLRTCTHKHAHTHLHTRTDTRAQIVSKEGRKMTQRETKRNAQERVKNEAQAADPWLKGLGHSVSTVPPEQEDKPRKGWERWRQ